MYYNRIELWWYTFDEKVLNPYKKGFSILNKFAINFGPLARTRRFIFSVQNLQRQKFQTVTVKNFTRMLFFFSRTLGLLALLQAVQNLWPSL